MLLLRGNPWPRAGDAVHYAPPIDGAQGGGECQPAVIAVMGEGPDDVYAELRTVLGEPVAERSMVYIAFGVWDAGGPRTYCGGTWHPVAECDAMADAP
jgi:hypothetical protein